MSMTSGQRVVMGCAIAAASVALFCVVLMGGCGLLLFKGAKDYPAWAEAGVVNPANKDVTDRINLIIADADTFAHAQAKLAAESWPQKVVYIGIKSAQSPASTTTGSGSSSSFNINGQNDSTEAYKRTSWSSNSTFSMNGNGYGSLGTPTGRVQIAIIERSQATAKGETLKYTVYIEHMPEPAAEK